MSGKQILSWCKACAPDCGPKRLHKTATPSQVQADLHSKSSPDSSQDLSITSHFTGISAIDKEKKHPQSCFLGSEKNECDFS